jgi:hypothetical protein
MAQSLAHIPCEQTCVAPHAMPQPPQFNGSDAVFAQAAPQGVRPGVHAQALFVQLWLAPHAVPHAPQFIRSFVVFLQPEEQLVSPAEHDAPPALPPDPVAPLLPPEPPRAEEPSSGISGSESPQLNAKSGATARIEAKTERKRMRRSLARFLVLPKADKPNLSLLLCVAEFAFRGRCRERMESWTHATRLGEQAESVAGPRVGVAYPEAKVAKLLVEIGSRLSGARLTGAWPSRTSRGRLTPDRVSRRLRPLEPSRRRNARRP